MNEWMDTIARYANEKADSFEAHADHLRSLGKDEKAEGLVFAASVLRADARVFGAMASGTSVARLRRVK